MTNLGSVAIGLSAQLKASDSYQSALTRLTQDRIASEIFAKNATLWGAEAEPEAQIRLGWTDVSPAASVLLPGVDALRAEFTRQGVDRFVLCGMGGSSLGPAVIAQWAGVELTMLDSTDPAAVARALDGDLSRTAVIVSSKSGSTIETRSHLDTFEAAFVSAGITPGERLVIVTDPGSQFEAESRDAGRHVFLADPNVGGRFSVLTAFGLVPGALAGAPVQELVAAATSAQSAFAENSANNPALQLAAALFAGLPERFVLALDEAPDARWGLGRWAEQLVAESTGKQGFGLLPIALDSDAPEFQAVPQAVVTARVAAAASQAAGSGARDILVVGELGAQFLAWEVATAALGHLMQIDPFNQPDVESAKIAARAALADAHGADAPGVRTNAGAATLVVHPIGASEPIDAGSVIDAATALRSLRDVTPADGYIAIQAYVDPEGALRGPLEQLRASLAAALDVPVALGYGPSYLHSVGQLHKGGPARGAFLQITDPGSTDLEIAKSDSSFATLIDAQARGDRGVLIERGRPVLALELAPDDGSFLVELAALAEH